MKIIGRSPANEARHRSVERPKSIVLASFRFDPGVARQTR